MKRFLPLIVSSLIVTLFSYLLTLLLLPDLASVDTYAPADKGTSWGLSDIYNSIAHSRKSVKGQADADIVIINIDGCSRPQIVSLIDAVGECAPKVVGLDVLFKYHSDDGLLQSIQFCDNIVLPYGLKFESSSPDGISLEGSFFYDALKDKDYGFVNLGADTGLDVVRQFRTYADVRGERIDNFSAAVVRLADPEKYDQLLNRGNEFETIYYSSYIGAKYDAAQVIDEEGWVRPEIVDKLSGKIVLIGDMKDPGDMHLTPVGELFSGIEIHSKTVATILYGRYIGTSPSWIDWLTAFLATMLLAFAKFLTETSVRFKDTLGLLIRLIQVTLLFMFIHIGVERLVNHNEYMDFPYSLLMTGFSAMAIDIYKGITEIVSAIVKKIRK